MAETQAMIEDMKKQRAMKEFLNPITHQKFQQLRHGMSIKEAVAILGNEHGKIVSESNMAGYHTVAIQWVNPNGSNLLAMFQNDELKSVAQSGL